MKLTIVYDNTTFRDDLEADWGFACLVETEALTLLFDTGARGSILLDNMRKLEIDPAVVGAVVISHAHWDHTGGLKDFLKRRSVPVYAPPSFRAPAGASDAIAVDTPREIADGVYSTGELKGIEQSLAIKTGKGIVAVAGCSHSGVGAILKAASQWGDIYGLVGGLHGFRKFGLLDGLGLVCATHCTQFIPEIASRCPDTFVAGGAGRVIEV